MPCASCTSARSALRRSQRNALKKTTLTTSASEASAIAQHEASPKGSDPEVAAEQALHVDHSNSFGNINETNEGLYNLSDPSASDTLVIAGVSICRQLPYDLRRKSISNQEDYQNTLIHSPRKRSRRNILHDQTEDVDGNSYPTYHQLDLLPDDVLLTIFRYLSEKDLCHLSQVCKRFQILADDLELWRKLYQSLYEYDLPLFHPEPCRFEFERVVDSELANPWKESFRQLYRGIHVRPGYQNLACSDRKIPFFNTIESALDFVYKNADRLTSPTGDAPLVFIHTGTYTEEYILIDCDVSIIGAAPGIVSHSVILDRSNDATIMFVEGAKQAYAGHMTLKFSADGPEPFGPIDPLLPIAEIVPVIPLGQPVVPVVPVAPLVPIEPIPPVAPMMPIGHVAPIGPIAHVVPPYQRNCCVDISENCCPVIDSCLIWSNCNGGPAVCVRGIGANPTIRRCDISHNANIGLCITNCARGLYEDNEICNNYLAGVLVKSGANPIVRRNHIHHGRDMGILIFDNGMGYFDNNDIHSNFNAGIEVKTGANPTIVNCEIHHGHRWGIYVHGNGRGQFMYNKIHSFTLAGVWITSQSNPTVRRNEIYNCRQGGVYIYDGRALVEYNNIYGDAIPGIQITSSGHPIIRYNNIYHL